MKKEIIAANGTTVVNTPLKTLEQATKKINKLDENTRNNLISIAVILGWVDKLKLYESKGYKNTAEYGEVVHGYKRQTTQALIRVADRFLDGTKSRLKQDDEKDYTVYQLMELIPLEDKEIESAIQDGELNPYMTTKKIRELAKGIKNSRNQENNEVQEENNEVQEENETEKNKLDVLEYGVVNLRTELGKLETELIHSLAHNPEAYNQCEEIIKSLHKYIDVIHNNIY